MKTFKYSEVFLNTISKAFMIDMQLFEFDVNSTRPDEMNDEFCSWHNRLVHFLYQSANYELKNNVVTLNLIVNTDSIYEFNKLWDSFIEEIPKLSNEYVIENFKRVTSINDSNYYILAKEVNINSIVLSITIGKTY